MHMQYPCCLILPCQMQAHTLRGGTSVQISYRPIAYWLTLDRTESALLSHQLCKSTVAGVHKEVSHISTWFFSHDKHKGADKHTYVPSFIVFSCIRQIITTVKNLTKNHQHVSSVSFSTLLSKNCCYHPNTENKLELTRRILTTIDQSPISLFSPNFSLLDLTAAFNTICHTLLLNQPETLLGITGTPLSWFKSSQPDNSLSQLAALIFPHLPFPMVFPRAQFLVSYFSSFTFSLSVTLSTGMVSTFTAMPMTHNYHIHTKPSDTLPPFNLTDCLHDINSWTTWTTTASNLTWTNLRPSSLLPQPLSAKSPIWASPSLVSLHPLLLKLEI